MLIAALSLLVVQSLAHMQLIYPAPFNASNNPHRTTGPDNYLQFPYVSKTGWIDSLEGPGAVLTVHRDVVVHIPPGHILAVAT